MDYRSVFKGYVAAALARKTGLPLTRALAMVEESRLGALTVGNLNFLSHKGADYWAEKVREQWEGGTQSGSQIRENGEDLRRL